MEVLERTRERTAADALPVQLADRLARIAWLAARSHGVRLDDILEGSRLNPAAAQARSVTIALASDLLHMEPALLARTFGVSERAIESARRRTTEHARCDPDFRTTLNFLKSSCAAVMGTT